MDGRLRYVAIIAVWLIAMLVLARYAPLSFKILIYNDNEILPHWTEASIVNDIVSSHLGNGTSMVAVVVDVGDINNTQYVLDGINNALKSANVSFIDLNTIYNIILNKYYSVTNRTAVEVLRNYTDLVNEIYANETALCRRLYRVNEEYYLVLSNYTSTMLAFNMGVKAFLTSMFSHMQFSSPTAEMSIILNESLASLNMSSYSPWTTYFMLRFVKLLNSTIGNYPIYAINLGSIEGAVYSSYMNVTDTINETYGGVLDSLANSTINRLAIALGPNPPSSLMAKLVASYFANSTPPLIKPYLVYLACSNESAIDTVISELNSSIRYIILESYGRPGYPYNFTVSGNPLINSSYTLVLANASSDLVVLRALRNSTTAYPFSVGIVLHQLSDIIESDVPMIDVVSGILVLAMLLFVLGTLMAPIVVLLSLILTYGSALGIVYLLGKAGLTVYYLTVYMISPIVFGIGVDYSLLIIGRYLEERRRGRLVEEAMSIVRHTSIPTILTSGAVVASGLGSFVVSNYQYIQVIGLSYIFTVALILITVTVTLAAIIGVVGDGILWPMGLKSSTRELSTRLIIRFTRFSLRRPVLIIVVASALTLAAALYVLRNPVTSDPIQLMPSVKSVEAYRLISEYFPGYIESTQYLVVEPNRQAAVNAIINWLRSLNVTKSVYIAYNSTDMAIIKAVTSYNALSDKLIPLYIELNRTANEIAYRYGVFVLVGGDAAGKYFFVKVFEDQFYGEIAFIIVALNIVLLSLMLRSIVVPLRLVATVAMSMVWSLAIGQLLFYGLLGVKTYWLLPIILYALLMSVGTDYDIFIVSRVREEVVKGLSDREAILTAVENTGPIVTGAAMVLASAFLSLTTSQLYILREIGFTVGVSVIIDAFIIRPLVMPAIMVLAGRYNWWPSRIGEQKAVARQRAAA